MKYITNLFIAVLCCMVYTCTNQQGQVDRHLSKRNKIVYVKDKIKGIPIEDVLIGKNGYPYIFDNYLIIKDPRAIDKLINVFDAKTFKLLGRTGDLGQGPKEISMLMDLFWNNEKKELYAIDTGSQNIYSFNIDSVTDNPNYQPDIKQKINSGSCPLEINYVNDTLSYCQAANKVSSKPVIWEVRLGKYNMITGDLKVIKYDGPDMNPKRARVSASEKYKRIVVCSNRFDIMSILDFNEKLICNVYGPNWKKQADDIDHYKTTLFYNGKILALYSGNRQSEQMYPTQVIIYSLNGEYIKTLDVGYQIGAVAADEQNRRLIFSFDDDIQFGYLDLDGIL